ncbi:MAG TPA: nucleotidyltransferase family protein, partial [Rhodospirillales bacterium]|nr:nucleotidyltransferase family protein [Rhodospirillales bacterium]
SNDILHRLRCDKAMLNQSFDVRSLALFGSVACGEAGPDGDIDLLVKFDRPVGLLHLSRTAGHLEELLGAPVDLVLRGALLPELRDDILREAVDAF